MTVAKLTGHTTSRMVELVYGHLNNESYTKAMALIPALPAEAVLTEGSEETSAGEQAAVNVANTPPSSGAPAPGDLNAATERRPPVANG